MATQKKTTTRSRSSTKAAEPEVKTETAGNVVPLEIKPRIPWHPKIGEMFGEMGVTEVTWPALVEFMFPGCDDMASILLALRYSLGRGFDPFKVRVWLVPYNKKVRDPQTGREEWKRQWQIQQSIDDLRATAFRTGEYAGRKRINWGPKIQVEYEDENGRVVQGPKVPEYGQATLVRIVGGQLCEFEGPEVYFTESYAHKSRSSRLPNEQWGKRPRYMLEKCVEAAALRATFPEELGGAMIPEEISIESDDTRAAAATDVTPEEASGVQLDPEEPDETDGVIDVEAEEPDETEPEPEDETEPEGDEAPGYDPFEYVNSEGEVALFETAEAFAEKICDVLAQIPDRANLDSFFENNWPEVDRMHALGFTKHYDECVGVRRQRESKIPKPQETKKDPAVILVESAAKALTDMGANAGRKAVDDKWQKLLSDLRKHKVSPDLIDNVARKAYSEVRQQQTKA